MSENKGFMLFFTNTQKIVFNVEESILNTVYKIPEKLYLFLRCFSANKLPNNSFNINQVNDNGVLVSLETVCYGEVGSIEFISLSSFFNIDRIFLVQDLEKNNYLAVASSDDTGRGGILVGCDKVNCDKVYKYRWEEAEISPDSPLLLESNIFDFVSKLYTIEMWEDRFARVSLYKNYNDTFYKQIDISNEL